MAQNRRHLYMLLYSQRNGDNSSPSILSYFIFKQHRVKKKTISYIKYTARWNKKKKSVRKKQQEEKTEKSKFSHMRALTNNQRLKSLNGQASLSYAPNYSSRECLKNKIKTPLLFHLDPSHLSLSFSEKNVMRISFL